jgi:hypothetical protein
LGTLGANRPDDPTWTEFILEHTRLAHGRVQGVAYAVGYLTSDASADVTGATLVVEGGDHAVLHGVQMRSGLQHTLFGLATFDATQDF